MYVCIYILVAIWLCKLLISRKVAGGRSTGRTTGECNGGGVAFDGLYVDTYIECREVITQTIDDVGFFNWRHSGGVRPLSLYVLGHLA